jgi:hypothetical protein
MKNLTRLLVCTATIVTVVFEINATPSTQIWIPSTDIQGFGVLHLGWDSYIKTESGLDPAIAPPNGYEPTVTNGGITVGVLPFKNLGLEVGIDYRDISDSHQYPIYFNAKLGVPEDAFFKYMPAIAVGSFDLGTKTSGSNLTNFNITYGLIAKNIWKLGRFSLGYYNGNDKALLVAKKDANGILASWDRTISEISDKLWLAIDYMGSKNSYGAVSFGLSYAIVPDASFIIGYDIWNDINYVGAPSAFKAKPTMTVQVDINLPSIQSWFKKAEKK